jgi:hypothetical protein
MRACTSGSFSAACSSAASRSTTGRGVPAVTYSAYQVWMSAPLHAGLGQRGHVGQFGRAALGGHRQRAELAAADLPIADEVVSNIRSTLLPMMSRCAWLLPL